MLARKLVPAEPSGPTSSLPTNDQQVSHQLVETDASSRRKPGRTKAEPGKSVRARRPDYIANETANEKLGPLGEQLVLRIEQERLTGADRPDLAAKVRHLSLLQNDTAGYDILSYGHLEKPRPWHDIAFAT
jgi:hypothetical protein